MNEEMNNALYDEAAALIKRACDFHAQKKPVPAWLENNIKIVEAKRDAALADKTVMKFYRLIFERDGGDIANQLTAAIEWHDDIDEVCQEFIHEMSTDLDCRITMLANEISIGDYRVLVKYLAPITDEVEY